jgi:regulator of protease activity HflC (stomatin/prohibitin superfamily)
MVWFVVLLIIIALYFLLGIRIINQYEKAVVFTIGKFTGVK